MLDNAFQIGIIKMCQANKLTKKIVLKKVLTIRKWHGTMFVVRQTTKNILRERLKHGNKKSKCRQGFKRKIKGSR